VPPHNQPPHSRRKAISYHTPEARLHSPATAENIYSQPIDEYSEGQ